MCTTFLKLTVAVVGLVLCVRVHGAFAGPKVTAGRPVAANQRVSMDRIDHSTWNGLLYKYVDEAGRVNYGAWHRSADDITALDKYLNLLSHADARIRASRQGQMAFWINAYNAVTIKGILREYPTSSIRNHTAKLDGYNIWYDLRLIVGDHKISLNDIERQVLRKMGDPRIHFAIVCASHSCPRLLNEAYTASKLEQQLSINTRNFFANRENFHYTGGVFYLSPILKWFAGDFGADRATLLRAISPYLPDPKSQRAAALGSGRISYLKYDWRLNEQRSARTAGRR